jgi:hypothetical protein
MMAGAGLAILAVAIVASGDAVARILYRRFAAEEPAAVERCVAGALLGLILWIAATWVLAIAWALTRRNLLVLAALFVIGGAVSARGLFSRLKRPSLVLLPIVAWCAFILWRSSIVPPASHDALTYHLPKAAMIVQAEGFPRFPVSDPRIRTFPSNYELLLADVLILTRSDALTEWIGTAAYLLFLGIMAMYAQRWWGPGIHVPLTVLAAAAAPLLLLHSGHDKNDLLTGVFAAGALYWSAQWCARRGAAPAVLAILCGVTAAGTKMNAAAIVAGIAPFGIAALIRKPPRLRPLLGAIAFALVALLLCGGWVFVQNARSGSDENATATTAGMPTSAYGQWGNLWEMPYLIARVSLGLDPALPRSSGERITWLTEDLYSSHFGALFAIALIALPFCIARYARDGDVPLRSERAIASGAAAIAFLILLPIVQVPSTPPPILRLSMFLLPIVFGWTLAPAVRELAASRFRRWIPALAGALVLVFAAYAVDVALNDLFVPLEHVRWCAAHPHTRRIFWSPNRAASIADSMAGPHDTIAVAGGRDVWRYPAYGAALSRTVLYVDAPQQIPNAAQWVVVDSTPEETRFFDGLRRDPRFALVYHDRVLSQSVFRRR